MFYFIKNLFIACIIGILFTIGMMQYDPQIRAFIGAEFCKALEDALDCRISCTIGKINFFLPSLELRDVHVYPKEGHAWHWHAKTYTTSCSWWHLLLSGSIDIHVYLHDIQAHSDIQDGTMAIQPHIERMLVGPTDIPLLTKSIILDHASCTITDPQHKRTFSCSGHSITKKIHRILKSRITIVDGFYKDHDTTYLGTLNGSLSVDALEHGIALPDIIATSKISGTIRCLNRSPIEWCCTGSWNKTKGHAAITTQDPALSIPRIIVSPSNTIHIDAHIPCSYVLEGLEGSIETSISTNLTSFLTALKGTIHVSPLAYHGVQLLNHTTCTIHADTEDIKIHGKALLHDRSELDINASWNPTTMCGTYTIKNNDMISLPWINHTIAPHDFSITGIHAKNKIDMTYTLAISHTTHAIKKYGTGTLSYINTQYTLDGVFDTYHYHAQCATNPWSLKNINIQNATNSCILSGAQEASWVTGSLDIDEIRTILKNIYDQPIQAQGILAYRMGYDNSRIMIECMFEKGYIRVPYTYNYIHKALAHLHIDTTTRTVYIPELTVALDKGSLSSNHGIIRFNDHADITHMHIPLMLNACHVNRNKNMHVTMSGSLLCEKKDANIPKIYGHMIIDHGHLKENIFSPAILAFMRTTPMVPVASLPLPDVALDIQVQTKDPIHLKTGFLDTNVHINMQCAGTSTSPLCSGMIKCTAGSLAFPYKPLFISRASLHFNPHDPYDPSIELIAKNTIKKHNITLQVHGTVQKPQIMLASSPPLTDDQIISMLITGSYEDSLNTVVPALVMQNLKDLILQSEQSPITVADHFKRMLKPLKRVHLIPRFADQTGRGGLRGALEIDVTDRLSVLLQKNFSLTEDTRLEVDYSLSDNISLRGVRDERKDVTGEVEMRWKF